MNRILHLPGRRCIDEVVLHDVATVHIEQMTDRCWWVGIDKADGTYWAGNFVADSRGRMTFTEQESTVTWERDDEHPGGAA